MLSTINLVSEPAPHRHYAKLWFREDAAALRMGYYYSTVGHTYEHAYTEKQLVHARVRLTVDVDSLLAGADALYASHLVGGRCVGWAGPGLSVRGATDDSSFC